MARLTPSDLIEDNLELFSLPEIVLQINSMINDPNASAADIGELISQDAALSARLLKIVNSPFYGFPSQIDTISMAITIVGTRQLRDLIMATSVLGKFKHIPVQFVDLDSFWRHNMATASAARILANRLQVSNTERYFIAGLLHDIGKLVMYITQPDLSMQVFKLAELPDHNILKLEYSAFGFDHAELGAQLLREWQLPESLAEPTACHHQPQQAQQYIREAAVVNLANHIANSLQPSISPDDDLPVEDWTWETLGIEESELQELIQESNVLFQHAMQMLYFDMAA